MACFGVLAEMTNASLCQPSWVCLPLLCALACGGGDPPSREGPRPQGSGGASSGASGAQSAATGVAGTTTLDIDAGIDDTPSEDCDNVLPVVYRDFEASHPDMEMDFSGNVVRHNLVSLDLGPDDKPVFMDSVGCPRVQDTPGVPGQCDNWQVSEVVITSAETFDQWYRTVPGVNIEFQKELELTGVGGGQYEFSSEAFFPLGPDEGYGVAPTPDHDQGRNFLFTTEIHVRFQYKAGQVFSFRGDDDLWIFVNGKLAMDLGSMHGPEEGSIDFDAQAADLGIGVGQSYPMDIFHAERHTRDSNFRFQTNISCFEPVVIK